MESGLRTEGVFHYFGWAARPVTTPVEMTNLISNWLQSFGKNEHGGHKTCHLVRSVA
jgi:hypothetical protein